MKPRLIAQQGPFPKMSLLDRLDIDDPDRPARRCLRKRAGSVFRSSGFAIAVSPCEWIRHLQR
jgi:hypothetical protein